MTVFFDSIRSNLEKGMGLSGTAGEYSLFFVFS